MDLTPDAIDEIGGRPRSLVEIPLPLSDKVAMVVIAACFVGTVPMLIGVAFLHRPEPAVAPALAGADPRGRAAHHARVGQALPDAGESPGAGDREGRAADAVGTEGANFGRAF
jgi:hypothetical protein